MALPLPIVLKSWFTSRSYVLPARNECLVDSISYAEDVFTVLALQRPSLTVRGTEEDLVGRFRLLPRDHRSGDEERRDAAVDTAKDPHCSYDIQHDGISSTMGAFLSG